MTKIFFRHVIIINSIFFALSFLNVSAQESENFSLQECWKFELDQTASPKIASDNVNELFFSSKGDLQAINLSDSKIHWKTELGGEVISNILYERERIFLVTRHSIQKKEDINNKNENNSESNKEQILVRSMSSLTGVPIWQKTFEIETTKNVEIKINIVPIDDALYIFSNLGEVLVLDKSVGQLERRLNLDFEFSTEPIVSNQKILIGTIKKGIHAISTEREAVIEGLNFSSIAKVIYVSNNAAGGQENIIIGDEFGTVYCYNLESKKLIWKMRTGAEIIDIKQEKKFLLISSNDNFVYSISEANGNINWKRRLAGRSQFAVSEDKNLLFLATINSDTLTVTKSDKGNTVNQFFLSDENYFVSSPLIVNDFVVVPTNSGFSVYNLFGCGLKKKPV